ncbi:MAG: fumarylacetoacetate hydrolase [Deltaproteobacteria bacterium]|nr:fumarylacetoacetate hydrolase [Deltaproteobacteria bacterium]
MKILRFNDDRIGISKDGNTVADVSDVISHRAEKGPNRAMEEFIERIGSARGEIEQAAEKAKSVPLSSVKLLAPIPRPSKVLAAFVNYLDRPGAEPGNVPIEFFYKSPELLGPEGTIIIPDIPPVSVFQPEAELGFVIGKRGKDVTESAAMDFVLGYMPFVDVSSRGMVRRTQFLGKGLDTWGPCGPWITTADEVGDPHALQVKSWVNGKPRQDYNTRDMAQKIPKLIAWVTRFVTLNPGDVITTGTFHEGLGPINDGDVLEIEVEKLGRAKFFTKGYGERKEGNWAPPIPQPGQRTGPGMTRV